MMIYYKTNILKLLEAGIPSEALARTIGFQGFLNGTWTVDISELIVIPLMFEFVADCMEEGIEKEEVNTDCLYKAIIEYMHTHTYTCNTDLLYE